ncbi:hypothetical protein GCM10018952_14940 [Streptosporangium vulgare]
MGVSVARLRGPAPWSGSVVRLRGPAPWPGSVARLRDPLSCPCRTDTVWDPASRGPLPAGAPDHRFGVLGEITALVRESPDIGVRVA